MRSVGSTNNLDLEEAIKDVHNPEELFRDFLEIAIQNRYSIAVWRLPDQQAVHFILDSEGYDIPEEIDLEELEKGFLFSPYDKGTQIFIRNHISFSTEDISPSISNEVAGDVRKRVEDLFDKRFNHTTETGAPTYYSGPKSNVIETKKNEYCQTVEESVLAIKSGVFEKVVPSKIKSLKFEDKFDVVDNFLKLIQAYPHSFTYFVSAPDIGSWIGASPESLIEIEDSNKFRTISLAATQELAPGVTPESVAWTQKEIEEQALVSRYIINCFKKIRLREFVEKGPKTVIAGKLLHLKTIFEVDMEKTGFHNLGTVMLKLLHPTSAVCGMPLEAADDFLQKVEKHERRYFCGFLGPVDNSHDTHLFVNLRCMELFENEAILYAGAGVTEDSIPEKEWDETEIKCNTLLDILAGK